LDSDENFMVYRRFGHIQARILLEKQERLRRLENKLDMLDKRQANLGDETVLCTLDLKDELKEPRDKLMKKVELAFNDYGSFFTTLIQQIGSNFVVADFLQKAQAMVAMNRPSSSEYDSVENFIANQRPLVDSQASSYYHREDLISLRPGREHAWLDATIETTLRKLNCDFVEVSKTTPVRFQSVI
jgi:hypothetical protein